MKMKMKIINSIQYSKEFYFLREKNIKFIKNQKRKKTIKMETNTKQNLITDEKT